MFEDEKRIKNDPGAGREECQDENHCLSRKRKAKAHAC